MAELDEGTLMLRILREVRADQAQHRTLILQTIDTLRRMDQRLDARISAVDLRIAGLHDNLELMIKSEIMGRMTNFETKYEHRLDKLEETTS